MLARARSKSAGLPARWVEGDARTFDLGEHFQLIFLTGNAFQAFLTNMDQTAVLGRVHAHLNDTGLFAFETRNPRWTGLETRANGYEGQFFNLETTTKEHAGQIYRNVKGQSVRTSYIQVYDHVAQILHITGYKRWHEGEEEHTQITRTALRYTFPQELAALLHSQGFTILRQYGDWNYEPLSAASPSIIVVCQKRR